MAQRDFLALDPYQFEEFVAQRMRECGYTKVQVTSKSGDYGADVLAVDPNGRNVCYASNARNIQGKWVLMLFSRLIQPGSYFTANGHCL